MNTKRKSIQYVLINSWLMILVILVTSCSVQEDISTDNFKKIPDDFSAQFYDNLDTISSYENKLFTKSLVTDFVDKANINYSVPLQISIVDNELFLSFKDLNDKHFVLKFYGRKHKNRFVFYTNYETVSFPFILMSKEMKKYRIYLTNTNEIIFRKETENTGMILFFGAGHSFASDYQFKLLKNE